ncbi:mRNA transport regulator mtr2 [Lodderomyces elongisporus]|uniref:mRNA transport regulator mtr2 n=1 Tax=Lodderomyces elongisporus TaxID=36914 RepID=UPI002926DB9A|nr:mRNA transport regulator mtr2 [Lodderomyces elongisporus]WLF79422.1 mRNA transport regulator mtr2 [Lodderomyces elongisporus]
MNQDPTQPIEPFLKNFLSSLDALYISPNQTFTNVESYATQFGSSLKRSSAIIVNGQPIIPSPTEDAKLQFQKKWLATPNSSHQLTSYDAHLIPGTNTFIINFAAKVKFDQSGKNRLGESADLVQDNNNLAKSTRPIWGSWFGVNGNVVVDNNFAGNGEIIDSLDYRFTYVPKDSVMKVL